MPVNLELQPGVPVAGVQLATVAAGIKQAGREDLVLISLPATTTAAAVFTRNSFAAAPVLVCREHMQANEGGVRALLINSGNANAGTGEPGKRMAMAHSAALARALSVPEASVLPFSTGVIGQLLPDAAMLGGIEKAVAVLADDWQAAARGIMTTDTVPKLTSRQIDVNGNRVTVTGMAKGAGMIQPDMATMLAYVFTDAAVAAASLQPLLDEAMGVSFNAITVDSDTSTNDACVLCATGATTSLAPGDDHWAAFSDAVIAVCRDLAQAIVRDAEGATKFITVRVASGRDRQECRQVAYAIANSPLVKTACFASDANVGRLLMAIGKADVADLDASAVRVCIGDVPVFEKGGIAAGYTEARGARVMAADEILLEVDLARGEAVAEIYTSDLSHDYVSINADYRS